MKVKLLAGEVATKEFWLIWVESAKHNAVEDPGHPGRELSDLIPWRSNGYDVVGTEAGRRNMTEASKREATVGVEVVENEIQKKRSEGKLKLSD